MIAKRTTLDSVMWMLDQAKELAEIGKTFPHLNYYGGSDTRSEPYNLDLEDSDGRCKADLTHLPLANEIHVCGMGDGYGQTWGSATAYVSFPKNRFHNFQRITVLWIPDLILYYKYYRDDFNRVVSLLPVALQWPIFRAIVRANRKEETDKKKKADELRRQLQELER